MIDSFAAGAARTVPGVAALLHQVGDALAGRFGVCTVRGEVSGFSRASSGHCYFNLKDADGSAALLRCAMFRRAASLLDAMPRDGQLVELRGRLGLYEPRGELQMVVEALRPAGAGALYEQFLRTKARLEALGFFDPARKRALPARPRAVGVVTSLGAAALHDVLTALTRRVPHVAVIVYPSPVQGAGAPAALAGAIATASERAEVDALIVCRGGGSLEDLWAFNDELVVRAIAAASMPVVSGVGHETDVTLADFAADLRAPTPTAAAELVATARDVQLDALAVLETLLRRRLHETLDMLAQRLDRVAQRLVRPGQALREQRQRLALLAHRLDDVLPRAAAAQQARLAQAGQRLQRALAQSAGSHARRLDLLAARLQALDPSQVLARGYAWLGDGSGHALTSIDQFEIGAALEVVLHDGSADVRVTGKHGRTPR